MTSFLAHNTEQTTLQPLVILVFNEIAHSFDFEVSREIFKEIGFRIFFYHFQYHAFEDFKVGDDVFRHLRLPEVV